MLEILTAIAGKVGGSVAWKALSAAWSAGAKALRRSPLASYRRELTQQISAMPFIYRDLELNAIDDFVDVELSSIDTRTFTVQKSPADRPSIDKPVGLNTGKWWRITNNKKVILIGEAGIGKTTIFRHLILSILSPSAAVTVYPREESLVPIYVPLKAIDANAASPVVRYILNSHALFSSPNGLAILTKLARRRQIALFLDGYDEVPHVGGTATITSELEVLYSDIAQHNSQTVQPHFEALYNELRSCRTLLSTRREFFLAYMPRLGHNTRHVGARGVGAQRQVLVGKIFQRYKRIAPTTYGAKLNEELFLQQLSQRANSAIAQISYNPLFLTALCFTYAQHVLANRRADETWSRGTYDLILECIRLLVIDIDENKVRGLPEDQRRALLNRRSAYPEQKQALLKHLAGRSYEDNLALFSFDWMTEVAQAYFGADPTLEFHDEILQGLRTQDATANILLQLVFSGVFVPYLQLGTHKSYDFPHRRFREVLAVEYFNTDAGCQVLCRRCSEEGINSLLIYFVQNTKYWSDIIRALAGAAATNGPNSTSYDVFVECLERGPNREAIDAAVVESIHALGRARQSPSAGLRIELAQRLPANSLDWLRPMFVQAIAQRDAWLAAVSFPPMSLRMTLEEREELFAEFFDKTNPPDLFSWQLLSYGLMAYEESDVSPHPLILRAARSMLHDNKTNPVQRIGSQAFFEFLKITWIGRSSSIQTAVETVLCTHYAAFSDEVTKFLRMVSKAANESSSEKHLAVRQEADELVFHFHKLATPISPAAWRMKQVAE